MIKASQSRQTPIGSHPFAADSRIGEVVQASGVGIYEYDIVNRAFFLSESAFALLGHPLSAMPQSIEEWWNFMRIEDREKSRQHARDSLHDPAVNYYEVSNRFYHRDGHEVTLLTRARIFRDDAGKPLRIFGVYIDITERLKLEEAVAQSEMQVKAERLASAEKDRVMSAISHEVRTPLNSILGFAKLIRQTLETHRDQVEPHLPKELYADLNQMVESAEHLDHLLTDFLDYSQLNSKNLKLVCVPFELADAVDQVSQRLLRACSAKGLGVELETRINNVRASLANLTLLGDQQRVGQVLDNVLSNAAKFSDSGRIQFSVDVNTNSDHTVAQLSFRISDQGCGIQTESMQRMFLPFEQSQRTMNGQLSGTGLGLAIVKALSEAMDGHIRIDSTPGVGTVFEWFVAMPLIALPTLGKTTVAAAIRAPARALSVLIADDVALNLKILERFIHNSGHFVTTASNGQEALEMAEQTRFDAILLDIEMPCLTGCEVVQSLRAGAGPNAKTPCYALSGQAFVKDIELAMQSGFDAYFPKPIQFDQLLNKLAELSDATVS
ncbi:PAS domain-containing hybrid sensor histidine kinase/response regulator [Limnobacter sp.]|uniref:PAS domain-containing hybrid sensor histidine kinase/response regulator n=1 Tax=Limnobacter sp. TaxID=2003368 RepID=UPI0025826D0A|nr:PAS domain-containing hybrid sensor histidine kinase/response regulator [Limnobacter sp.]